MKSESHTFVNVQGVSLFFLFFLLSAGAVALEVFFSAFAPSVDLGGALEADQCLNFMRGDR